MRTKLSVKHPAIPEDKLGRLRNLAYYAERITECPGDVVFIENMLKEDGVLVTVDADDSEDGKVDRREIFCGFGRSRDGDPVILTSERSGPWVPDFHIIPAGKLCLAEDLTAVYSIVFSLVDGFWTKDDYDICSEEVCILDEFRVVEIMPTFCPVRAYLPTVKVLKKLDFLAWEKDGESVIGLVNPDDGFSKEKVIAMVCPAHPEVDKDYPWCDKEFDREDVSFIRPATAGEVRAFLRVFTLLDIERHMHHIDSLVFGDNCYILMEDDIQ